MYGAHPSAFTPCFSSNSALERQIRVRITQTSPNDLHQLREQWQYFRGRRRTQVGVGSSEKE